MRIAALGSGSKGNATLLQFGASTLMVDCGFGLKETIRRLAVLEIEPDKIDAILVTHEHQDHISGVEALAAKFGISVYMTEGTARVWKSRGRVTPELMRADQHFSIENIEVHPVAVPHDAREPVQFVFQCEGHKVGILTDIGSFTRHVCDAYRGCQTLLIEANHDLEMLQNGAYPFSLKRRVAGNWGHLNNTQTAEFVAYIDAEQNLEKLIIGHISEQNNHVDLVARELGLVDICAEKTVFASQGSPLDWIDFR